MVQSQSTPADGVHIGVEMIDLGVRLTVASEIDGSGRPESTQHIRFEERPTPDDVIDRLAAVARADVSVAVASVGIAVWGLVDAERGEITDPRFGVEWQGYRFGERLAERLGAPVRVVAGVVAAAQAEATVGASAGRSPLLFVHLGRTVASAFVVNGVALAGATGAEGRLGHWQTGLRGPRCACGAYDHLEPLVSAQSLVRLAIGAVADDDDALAAITRVTGGRAEALTAPQVVALARDGVGTLRELVDATIEALSRALANLVVTFDPAEIRIGGPLALADRVYFDWLRDAVAARLSGVRSPAPIGPAALEPRGGLVGALLLKSH